MRAEIFHWFMRGAGLAFGAALAIAIIYGLVIGARVVVLVFIALLLASGLAPLIEVVRQRTGMRRGVTLLLVYAGFLIALLVLALLIIPGAINQFNDLGQQIRPLLADARAWAASIEPRALSSGLIGLISTFERALAPRAVDAPEPDQLIALGLTFADIVISVIAVLTLVYFWLTERARMQRFALALLPAPRRAGAHAAWNEIELRLGAWVRGQLILMTSIGLATSIAYFLIGLEGALLLGLIAALAEAIPLIGPAIGAIPALFAAALTGQMETVVIVALVYVVIQIVEGNVLVPIVMRNTIGIPPFVVIVSILAGAAIAGIPGALISVPAAAALLVVVERLQARQDTVPLRPQPPTEAAEAAEAVEEIVSSAG